MININRQLSISRLNDLLPNEESNLAPQNQNLMYYRYTIRQRKLLFLKSGCKGTANFWSVQIYSHFFWFLSQIVAYATI